MAKHRLRPCEYCGKLSHSRTKDHAVSECLWGSRPLPPTVVTVPSCERCNSFWSRYEGYFRSMCALMAKANGHPVALELLRYDPDPARCGEAMRHVLHKDDKLLRFLEGGMKREPSFLPNGVYAGTHTRLPMDWRRWHTIVGKMVRGLFYGRFGYRLPDTHAVGIYRGDGFLRGGWEHELCESMGDTWTNLGGEDDVFLGRCVRDTTDPNMVAFHLVIYRSVGIFAMTLPHEGEIKDPSHPVLVDFAIEQFKRNRKRIIRP